MKGNDRQRQKERMENRDYKLSEDQKPAKVRGDNYSPPLMCISAFLKVYQPAVARQLGVMAGYGDNYGR